MEHRHCDYVPKDKVRIYYARAMDGLEASEIIADDRKLQSAIDLKGFCLVNPYQNETIPAERAEALVADNAKLLDESDVLLANLTLSDYTYVGAIFEVVQAANAGIPVIICAGSTGHDKRYYLHHFCDFICGTIDEGLEYIWRTLSWDGLKHQLKESQDLYDRIAIDYDKKGRKEYSSKDKDRAKYEEERLVLRKKIQEYCADKTVLELGCGSGDWTQTIAKVCKSVICIEISANMIAGARKRLAGAPIQPEFICGDFLDNKLSVEPCDVIISYFAISFLPPFAQNELLSNIHRWARKDGCCLFGESIQISTTRSMGFGRRRIEYRNADRAYLVYKEYFTPTQLQQLLESQHFTVFECFKGYRWFAFCAARTE